MEALTTANSLYIDESYEDAVLHYKRALETDSSLFVAASNLAAAYLKLGQYSEALVASQHAISINPESSFGYLRTGLSHFYMGAFQTAVGFFEQAEAKASGSASKWIAKCRAELAKTQLTQLPYTWYQSEDTIFIGVRVKAAGTPQVDIQTQKLIVRATCTSGNEFNLDLSLADTVDVAGSSYQVLSNSIEVKLKKAKVGCWIDICHVDLAKTSRPSYPSSSKVKRDWDKLDREAEAEIKKDKLQGEAALQDLFKQIYSNSDEDTRRAMIKSFQTSGGTVLSTNWQEVAAKDYEGADRPEAPEGQQWADQKE